MVGRQTKPMKTALEETVTVCAVTRPPQRDDAQNGMVCLNISL